MIIVLVIIVAAAWAAIGAIAVLAVLGAGKLARRGSVDEHFYQAAGIIREERLITDEEIAAWTRKWQEHPK